MNIYFKKCSTEDFEFYYQLKCDEENIYWTGHIKRPDKTKLKKWFNNQIKRHDRLFFLVKSPEFPNKAIGYLYLDIVGDNNNIIEIGHAVHSKFKSKGIGTKIIKFALDHSREKLLFIDRVDGWIAENNIGSIKNFLKNGYIETNDIKEIYFESLNKEITMKRFFYEIKR